jgi:hypothetical protein
MEKFESTFRKVAEAINSYLNSIWVLR